MAIRNDVMFVDMGRDAVAVDVSDWANVQKLAVCRVYIIVLMHFILKDSLDTLNA